MKNKSNKNKYSTRYDPDESYTGTRIPADGFNEDLKPIQDVDDL